ncbi:MAG: hypothetical protein SGILL_004313 [Bacillariaceae sp.]
MSRMDYVWDILYNAGITSAPPDSAIFPQHYRDINRDYVFHQQLGVGTWGTVKRVSKRTLELRKVDVKKYACKTILKSHLDDPILLRREVFNFERCQMAATPHIAKLVDVYEDLNAVHIIMEECGGQELYDEIATGGGLDEDIIARIMWQGLTALSYMHEVCHVCHRDLKASNFLFNEQFLGVGITDEKEVDIRIIDFGFSIHVNLPKEESDNIAVEEQLEDSKPEEPVEAEATNSENPNDNDKEEEKTKEESKDKKEETAGVLVEPEDAKSISENTATTAATAIPALGAPVNDPTDVKLLSANGVLTSEVGTPYYTAPEVVCADHYDFKCDIYSMGAIAYSCLTGGKLPIKGKDERETIKLLMYPKKPIDFSDKVWLGYKEPEPEDGNEEKKESTNGDGQISQSARDFCKLLLQRDPNDRPSAYEAMQHEWLKSRFGVPPPLPEPIPDDLMDAMKLTSLSTTAPQH